MANAAPLQIQPTQELPDLEPIQELLQPILETLFPEPEEPPDEEEQP
jgi:hypothetical protein